LTKFNQLILIATREFSSITTDVITDLRKSHHIKVARGIETSVKKSAVRNASEKSKFSKTKLSDLYDRYYSAQFYSLSDAKEKADPNKMEANTFIKFILELSNWPKINETEFGNPKNPGVKLIKRIYDYVNSENQSFVKFDDVAVGLGNICESDMLFRIEWLFNMYDSDSDGYLINDEIIYLSEALLYMLKSETEIEEDQALRSISTFLNNCFEYCDKITSDTDSSALISFDESTPEEHILARRLSLSALRAVILSDIHLEK
jgi:hypothetical protein